MSPVMVGFAMLAAASACAVFALVADSAPRVSTARLAGRTTVPERSTLTGVTDGVVAGVDRLMLRRGWVPFTTHELELAGVTASPASVVVLIASIAVACFAVGLLIWSSAWVGVLLVVLAVIGAKVAVKVKTSRRRRKFAGQLHESLQMMASSLRAGHSMTRALDSVAQDSDPPISEELARAVNEYRLGRDVVESLEQVAARMESDDFLWVTQAISAQRETGGNLNEVLDQVSETIRERNHIRQQVFALSAEGRISAYILMGLPVLLGVFYMLVNPGVMSPFIASNLGKILLGASAVMYVLAGLWMRKIVNIEF